MVLDPSANFVRQSLGSSVDTNDPETIDVSDASAFPDPSTNQYNLVLWDTAAGRPDQDSNREIVRVTGRDTGADTLTVARAQEGTSNEKHPNTSAVQLAHTAKLRDDTDSAVGSMGSFSGTPPTIDDVTASVNNDSVQTDEINNVEQIPTDVSDAGAYVNSLISEYGSQGVAIKAPPTNLPLSTQIDLTNGVNNQVTNTPIKIIGAGQTETTTTTGATVFDCSSLGTTRAIVNDGKRSNIQLEGFTLANGDSSVAPIDLSGSGGNYTTNSIVRDVTVVDGWDQMRLGNMFGSVVQKIRASNTKKGIRMDTMNAANISGITVRNSDDGTAPAIVVNGGFGFTVQNIYAESNNGRGLSVSGNCRGASFNGLYFENNNRSNSNSREFVLGDTSIETGVPSQLTFSGLRFSSPANTFGSERLTVDDAYYSTIEATRYTNALDLYHTTARGNQMVYQNCQLNNVDTASAGFGPSTWIANQINGTTNRKSAATVVSGD